MKVIDIIIEDLKNVNDWRVSRSGCCLENNRNDIRIWIANIPVLDTNLEAPFPLSLSLYEKWKLYKATKVAKENYMLRLLNTKRYNEGL